jgi:hypothetical protein
MIGYPSGGGVDKLSQKIHEGSVYKFCPGRIQCPGPMGDLRIGFGGLVRIEWILDRLPRGRRSLFL